MIILGIDPGLATMGYGVLKVEKGVFTAIDCGVITTPKDATLPKRLFMLESSLEKLVEHYKPDQIAIEELFFTKNITTGIAVAEARGVILLTAIKLVGDEVYEYTPMQIKLAVTGNGAADKHQMQAMVKILLKLAEIPRPDDAADALAAALAHAQTGRFGGLYRVS